MAVAGLALGAVASLALGRLVSGLLFGVRPWDPLTFVGVAVVMTAAAAAASLVPARQSRAWTRPRFCGRSEFPPGFNVKRREPARARGDRP